LESSQYFVKLQQKNR